MVLLAQLESRAAFRPEVHIIGVLGGYDVPRDPEGCSAVNG